MSEVLGDFIAECRDAASEPILATVELNEDAKSPKEKQCELLIGGCVDWENMTTKNCQGLDNLHRLIFPGKLRKVFSSSSAMHFFVVLCDGSLFAMGRNECGQLGTANSSPCETPTKVTVGSAHDIIKIACGRSHTLILLASGEVYGSGSNALGQLGMGDGKASKSFLTFTKINHLSSIVDIAAGDNHSICCTAAGRVVTFGHPSNGQLGHGTNGEYIREGGRGAAVQFDCVTTPKRIEQFLVKDAHGKVVDTLAADDIKMVSVSAGKNHSCCQEDRETGIGRVFSWGFGGYGRLGHNSSDDELRPREITFFTQMPTSASAKPNPQRQVTHVVACSTYSLAVSASKNLYFFGKLSNSPRGEASIYPKVVQELYDYKVVSVSGGNNIVVVSSGDHTIGWGAPVAGAIGFGTGVKSSTNPKFITDVADMVTMEVVCGYGHICYIVGLEANEDPDRVDLFQQKMDTFPLYHRIDSGPDVEVGTKVSTKQKPSSSKRGRQGDGDASGSVVKKVTKRKK